MRKMVLPLLSVTLLGCNLGDKIRDELQERISEEIAKNKDSSSMYENGFDQDVPPVESEEDSASEPAPEEREPEETEPEDAQMRGCEEPWSGGARYGELISSEGEYGGIIWLDDRCSGYLEIAADLRLWSMPTLVIENEEGILATTELVHGVYEFTSVELLWIPADHTGVPLRDDGIRPINARIFDAGGRVDDFFLSEALAAP